MFIRGMGWGLHVQESLFARHSPLCITLRCRLLRTASEINYWPESRWQGSNYRILQTQGRMRIKTCFGIFKIKNIGVGIELLPRMPGSHRGVSGFSPGLAPDSRFLLTHTWEGAGMANVVRCLPCFKADPYSVTAPGFSLGQPRLLWAHGKPWSR